MSAIPAVGDLSLYGLLTRLAEVERLKGVRSLDEEQTSILESEVAVKKAAAELIQIAVRDGVTSREKKLSQEFLQGQLKSIEDGSKGAEARRSKLTELLAGIQAASSKDEPAHVSKAKKDLAKAEKAFEEVSKNYEKWEKGKKMLNIDEVKTLKRAYEEGNRKIEKAKALVEEQLTLRAESAAAPLKDEPERGSAAVAVDNRAGRGKGGGKGGGRASAPAVSMRVGASAGGGYSQPATGGPSAAALRQAQMAAEVRSVAAAEAQAAQSSPAPAPRPRPAPARPKQEDDVTVLSYACTCKAVAEHLRITEDQARDLAESSREFARHFDADTWELVKERSIAIEKANSEKQREKEKKKQAAALAKATERETAAVAGLAAAKPAAKPLAKAPAPRPSPGGPSPAAKPKAKTNAGAKRAAKPEGLEAYASSNRFGGFEDSDDDFWTTVKR